MQTILIGSGREGPWHCSLVFYLPGDNPFSCLEPALTLPSHWPASPRLCLVPQYHAPWWVSVSCTPGLAVPSRASSTALPCPFTAQEGAELSADTWPVLSLPCMPSCSFTHHCSDSHVSLLTQIQPKGGCTQVFPPSAPHESSPLLMLLAF